MCCFSLWIVPFSDVFESANIKKWEMGDFNKLSREMKVILWLRKVGPYGIISVAIFFALMCVTSDISAKHILSKTYCLNNTSSRNRNQTNVLGLGIRDMCILVLFILQGKFIKVCPYTLPNVSLVRIGKYY